MNKHYYCHFPKLTIRTMIHFALLLFTGTLAVVTATDVNSSTKVDCQSPFMEVGGRCLHLEHNAAGTWTDMRQYCQELEGDLVNLADLQFYGDLMLYIYSLNLPEMVFWIAATDERVEGLWEWTDGTSVRMGTPYWANYGVDDACNQTPEGGTAQNCAVLDGNYHYYFNDYPCSKTYVHPICEK